MIIFDSMIKKVAQTPLLCNVIAFLLLTCVFPFQADGQIAPPGYDREVKSIQERQQTSVLDRDSVMLVDTITLFDPATYEETMRIVKSNMSLRDYLTVILGVNQPDQLLNGTPVEITDPRTFENLTIRWNSSAGKIDTVRQR